MTENTTEKLQELLQDQTLQDQLAQATTQDETIQLIVAAGVKQGYDFTAENVAKDVAKLMAPASQELSEDELLNVAGRLMAEGRMSFNNDCNTAYGTSCATKFQCYSNLCTSGPWNC